MFSFTQDDGITAGHGLTAKVMRLWHNRAKGLNHDYALVGYLLCPNPTIMNHAKHNRSAQHDDAVKRLINKLIVPSDAVGDTRDSTRAKMGLSFWREFTQFTTRTGVFADPDMWIIAEDPDISPHEWWNTYGRIRTTVCGQLACLVLSKNLGIGSAERHWKLVKAAKAGQRARLGEEKTKKCALVHGVSMHQRARHKEKKLQAAGKIWTDEDFESLKLDVHCKEIIEKTNEFAKPSVRIFRCWEEEWEKAKLGPNGDVVLEARLVHKYAGIKWLDPDNKYRVCEAHPDKMHFEKKRGNNQYLIFATYHGFTVGKDLEDQADKYDYWEKSYDFYEQVQEYYKDSKEVKVYLKGGECDSESDNDE